MMREDLKVLIQAYVELNKLHATPGERCHMLAMSIKFIQAEIKQLLKREATNVPSTRY